LLDAFCEEEALEDSWRCPKCGACQGLKQFRLWRLPPVIQLHLKRFHWKPKEASLANSNPSRNAGQSLPSPKVAEMPLLEVPVQAKAHESCGPSHTTAAVPPVVEEAQAVVIADNALDHVSATHSWEDQERMYTLILQLLKKIGDHPGEPKFRSVSKAAARVQKDVLGLSGGASLLQWSGFRDVGERYDAGDLTGAEAESRYAELLAHGERTRMQVLRRLRDERIEAERRRSLPTGDREPIRRWGGRLPAFGRHYDALSGLLVCTKIETRVELALDVSTQRGFMPLRLDKWLGEGAPCTTATGPYGLYGVVQHLGHSPFSGHYVASCWHEASGSWWHFNDSNVSRMADTQLSDVLTGGSYVLFLDRLDS